MDSPDGLRVFAPLFLLSTEQNCSLCGKSNTVVVLATRRLESDDPEEFEDIEDDGFLLSYVEALPDVLLAWIQERFPTYEIGHSLTADADYFMINCSCGGHYGDHYVGRKILDLAFRDPKSLGIERLPISGPWEIPCSYRSSDALGHLLDRHSDG